MIVKRNELTWFERLYLPALIGGLKVTTRHFINTITGTTKVTQQYPEEPTKVLPGYRGAPYLVRDQDGATKCVSCQLCEFVCPPKAIRITPGEVPEGGGRDHVEKAPKEFDIDMLRCIYCGLCQEVCPEEAIFLQKDYSLTGRSREEMIYNKEKLLQLGGTHAGIQKWKHKLEEAREQEMFPVKTP